MNNQELYYDNFQQVRYLNPFSQTWRNGLCHHDWLLDYDGFAYKLENIIPLYDKDIDDMIIELDWRNLKEVSNEVE